MRGCVRCAGGALTVQGYLDRSQSAMVAEANNEGRWAYNGEGFIDGVFRVECSACAHVAYDSSDCPRCHAPGALAAIRASDSRLTVPKKCPRCAGLETQVIGFAPARTEVAGGKPGKSVAGALLGEPGFHVVAVACADCDWAVVAEGCPLCGAPSPIRARPA
ncbi:MAG TPA: hypothetical protein PKU97_00730 [Kofleriaceae bacterium]|nr:hypothetical protein [Kofleriaceae bacterium]